MISVLLEQNYDFKEIDKAGTEKTVTEISTTQEKPPALERDNSKVVPGQII